MKIFEPNRMKDFFLNIEKIKEEVLFTVVEPLNITINSKVIVFLSGLNGERTWLKYFNHSVFDDNFLISFDQKGQAKNKEKPSQFYKNLVNYNLKVLEYIYKFSEFKNRKIILIGESWGANSSLLIAKKRPDLISGFVIWNMPGKLPTRNSKVTRKQWVILSLKTLLTFLTGINTKSIIFFDERLTSNKLLIRTSNNFFKKTISNKMSLSVFFSIRPSWRIIIKNNLEVPFIYVQSMEDLMINKKRLDKIKNYKNVVIFEKGYHILILEKNSLLLGDEIQKIISLI